MPNALVANIFVLIAAAFLVYHLFKPDAVRNMQALTYKLGCSLQTMHAARSASVFVNAYKAQSDIVKRLMSLRGFAPTRELGITMDKFFRAYEHIPDEEKQILLRNAIVRQKDDVMAYINWGARKTERQKKQIYDLFVSDLEKASWFFSKETRAYADRAIDEVRLATGLALNVHPSFASRQ